MSRTFSIDGDLGIATPGADRRFVARLQARECRLNHLFLVYAAKFFAVFAWSPGAERAELGHFIGI
ncbi:MAG: hypothetical protein ACPGNV_01325 [Mangrovicoccus sp.]